MIKLVALDIDGVLTDGKVILDESGKETKTLSYRDIDAIFTGKRKALSFALITGENSPIVDVISKRLEIDLVFKNAKDKVKAIEQLSQKSDIPIDEICYIGDSDRDADALAIVGLGLVPADATEKAKNKATKILKSSGGNGAVYEAMQIIWQYMAQYHDSEESKIQC